MNYSPINPGNKYVTLEFYSSSSWGKWCKHCRWVRLHNIWNLGYTMLATNFLDFMRVTFEAGSTALTWFCSSFSFIWIVQWSSNFVLEVSWTSLCVTISWQPWLFHLDTNAREAKFLATSSEPQKSDVSADTVNTNEEPNVHGRRCVSCYEPWAWTRSWQGWAHLGWIGHLAWF